MTNQALMRTFGLTPATTAKVMCNKIIYAVARTVTKPPPAGWLHSRWHWYRSPFSLRKQILWSRSLGAWFYVEDETSLENMLQMPDYEPVSWVAPKPGDVFIDVGAHIGWYTIKAAKAVGSAGRVIALEPDETNRGQLARNLSLNRITNCSVVPAAAWSRSGLIRWVPGEVSVWHQIDETRGSLHVQAITLDELASQLALARLDWIKLDIEGAEVDAIKGAKRILERFGPDLFIEIHETLEPVKRLLAELGYSIDKVEFDQLPDLHGWILARHR
jgi:FkbM family methyltransferase